MIAKNKIVTYLTHRTTRAIDSLKMSYARKEDRSGAIKDAWGWR